MRSRPRALLQALELARVPAFAQDVRLLPLPDDIVVVIRIAGGCEITCAAAEKQVNEPRAVIREAAAFYLKTALFSPEADSYRILGGSPAASREELRENFYWLMKWVHPDTCEGWDSVFAGRVLDAWSDVKDSGRRESYDRRLHRSRNGGPAGGRHVEWRSRSFPFIRRRYTGQRSNRVAVYLAVGSVGVIACIGFLAAFGVPPGIGGTVGLGDAEASAAGQAQSRAVEGGTMAGWATWADDEAASGAASGRAAETQTPSRWGVPIAP